MQMFATQTLDVGTFLKADYSIATRTASGAFSRTYAGYLVLGTVLVILFTVVIPLFYFLVIYKLRFRLQVCFCVLPPSCPSGIHPDRSIMGIIRLQLQGTAQIEAE